MTEKPPKTGRAEGGGDVVAPAAALGFCPTACACCWIAVGTLPFFKSEWQPLYLDANLALLMF